MSQQFKWLQRAEIKPGNRSLGITTHTLIDSSGIDSSGPHAFSEFVRLEIATYGTDQGFYLLHICADGTGTDTWHQTLDDALRQAEVEFRVGRSEWRDL